MGLGTRYRLGLAATPARRGTAAAAILSLVTIGLTGGAYGKLLLLWLLPGVPP